MKICIIALVRYLLLLCLFGPIAPAQPPPPTPQSTLQDIPANQFATSRDLRDARQIARRLIALSRLNADPAGANIPEPLDEAVAQWTSIVAKTGYTFLKDYDDRQSNGTFSPLFVKLGLSSAQVELFVSARVALEESAVVVAASDLSKNRNPAQNLKAFHDEVSIYRAKYIAAIQSILGEAGYREYLVIARSNASQSTALQTNLVSRISTFIAASGYPLTGEQESLLQTTVSDLGSVKLNTNIADIAQSFMDQQQLAAFNLLLSRELVQAHG